jgi:hypothetical protein
MTFNGNISHIENLTPDNFFYNQQILEDNEWPLKPKSKF